MVAGQEYTEDNLAKLIEDVKTNWQDAEFSDEEFKKILNEILSKTMSNEDISRSTIDVGIGLEETNAVINEIRRTQTKDNQKEIKNK